MLKGVNWFQNIEKALEMWPKIQIAATGVKTPSPICGACYHKTAEITIIFAGDAYDKTTLKSLKGVEENTIKNFSVCKQCSSVGQLIHRLTHLKWSLRMVSAKAVEEVRASSRNMDTATILSELLEKDIWVNDLFNRVQTLWADADAFNL